MYNNEFLGSVLAVWADLNSAIYHTNLWDRKFLMEFFPPLFQGYDVIPP